MANNMDDLSTELMIEKIKYLIDKEKIAEALISNELKFEHEEKQYKLIRLTPKLKQDLYKYKMKKHLEYLQEKDDKGELLYKNEEDLKKIYKERGIDIDEMSNKMVVLEVRKKDFMKKIGIGLSTEDNKAQLAEPELQALKEEIENIDREIQKISLQKSQLMEYSVESQTFISMVSYATYLSLHILEGDKYIPVVTSYDEFLNLDNALVSKASFYASILVTNELSNNFI